LFLPRKKSAKTIWYLKGNLVAKSSSDYDRPDELHGLEWPEGAVFEKRYSKWGKPVELFNGRDLTGWRPTESTGRDLEGRRRKA